MKKGTWLQVDLGPGRGWAGATATEGCWAEGRSPRAVKTLKGDLANLPIFIDEGNQGPEVTHPVCGVARTGSLAHYCPKSFPEAWQDPVILPLNSAWESNQEPGPLQGLLLSVCWSRGWMGCSTHLTPIPLPHPKPHPSPPLPPPAPASTPPPL